jgi:hypothetical protein
MGLSESYHAYAADCLLLAQRTEDADRKAILLNMVECWRALAARADLAEDGADINPVARH